VQVLNQGVTGAAERAEHERERAATMQARAKELDVLCQPPFEHADSLLAAVARKDVIEAVMQEEAEQTAAETPERAEWEMPEELFIEGALMPLDLPHIVIPEDLVARLAGEEAAPPVRTGELVRLPAEASEIADVAVAAWPAERAPWRGGGEQGVLDLDVVSVTRSRQRYIISVPLTPEWAALAPVQNTLLPDLPARGITLAGFSRRRRPTSQRRAPVMRPEQPLFDVMAVPGGSDSGGHASPGEHGLT
jgi:hypothetical protein